MKFSIFNFQFPKNSLEAQIINTLEYFSFFNYPPTLGEIYTFLKKKAQKRQIMSILEKMEKKSLVKGWKIHGRGWMIEDGNLRVDDRRWRNNQKLILSSTFYHLSSAVNAPRYTLHQYSKKIKNQRSKIKNNNQQPTISNFSKRQQISINKLNSWRFRLYIRLLSRFPQIKLIGLSGSVAMLNAADTHDVDLFIITARNRLWTGRFIALVLAQILGIRRKRHQINQRLRDSDSRISQKRSDISDKSVYPSLRFSEFPNLRHSDKVCLNLFFDESDLAVPKFKRSEYVGHEVLQMKPIEQKDEIYLRFIDANSWVFDIFPNSKSNIKYQISNTHIKNQKYFHLPIFHYLFDILFLIFDIIQSRIETSLKKVQIYSINKHRTSELISNTQLWFHPEDFSLKLKKAI